MTKTALLLIDLQNDFFRTISNTNEIVHPINTLIDFAIKQDWLIIASRDWHSPELFSENFEKSHCLRNSSGAEFYPALSMNQVHYIISKGEFDISEKHYSAFNGDNISLLNLLNTQQVNKVIIAGLATNYCVMHTVLDAIKYSFQVTVVADCCRGINKTPTSVAESIEQMQLAGAHITQSSSFNIEKK